MNGEAQQGVACKMCGSHDVQFGQLCDECKGISRPPSGSLNAHLIQDKPKDVGTCRYCGEEFEPYPHGRYIQRLSCRRCMREKRLATMKSRRGSKNPTKEAETLPLIENTTENQSPVFPPLPADAPKFDPVAALKKWLHDGLVVLDFSPAPEVLAWLKEHHENVPAYLMALIFEDIPSEVVKLWVLDRLRGA